jgi:[protein-PII] uridylyltransferase
MRAGFTEFLLCTRDVHGLFSKVAGTLTSAGLNILGANVYTTRNGEALEVYRVSTPAGGPDEKRLVWERVERSLECVLSGEVEVEALIRQRPRPIGATASPSRQPPSVTVSNADSDFYPIADVAANDRIGLLYDLTRAIADLGHEIYISKATTVLDQVADTFYLKDRDGKKITDPAQLAALEQALRRAVEGGEPSHD